MLSINPDKTDSAVVVALEGRIDASSAKQLEQHCLDWIDAGETLMVLDFAAVQYISSAGLRALLLAARKMGAVNGEIRLSALNPTLGIVFEISGFSQLFAIFPTTEAAMATA